MEVTNSEKSRPHANDGPSVLLPASISLPGYDGPVKQGASTSQAFQPAVLPPYVSNASWFHTKLRRLTKLQTCLVVSSIALLVVAAVLLGVLYPRQLLASSAVHYVGDNDNVLFAEDFKGPLDLSKWNYNVGNGQDYGLISWGNSELQCYTDSTDSVDIIANPDNPADGVLRIRAQYSQQFKPCQNRIAAAGATQWTSGKLDTKHKQTFKWLPASSNRTSGAVSCTPIVIESRIRVPYQSGKWSAFWLMPEPQAGVKQPGCPKAIQDSSSTTSQIVECGAYGMWPKSGEIDIMEHINQDSSVLGTVHYANSWGQHAMLGKKYELSAAVIRDWNTYRVVWGCESITWYVNDVQTYQVTKSQFELWPFDQPFFILLNTAVGGQLVGSAAVDQLDGEMLVDYVRVYTWAG